MTQTEHTLLDEERSKVLKILQAKTIYQIVVDEARRFSILEDLNNYLNLLSLPRQVKSKEDFSNRSEEVWLLGEGTSGHLMGYSVLMNTNIQYDAMPLMTRKNLLYQSGKSVLDYGFGKARLKGGLYSVEGWYPSLKLAIQD